MFGFNSDNSDGISWKSIAFFAFGCAAIIGATGYFIRQVKGRSREVNESREDGEEDVQEEE